MCRLGKPGFTVAVARAAMSAKYSPPCGLRPGLNPRTYPMIWLRPNPRYSFYQTHPPTDSPAFHPPPFTPTHLTHLTHLTHSPPFTLHPPPSYPSPSSPILLPFTLLPFTLLTLHPPPSPTSPTLHPIGHPHRVTPPTHRVTRHTGDSFSRRLWRHDSTFVLFSSSGTADARIKSGRPRYSCGNFSTSSGFGSRGQRPTFISKAEMKSHFVEHRKAQAEDLEVTDWLRDPPRFTVANPETGSRHLVTCLPDRVVCDCEDYHWQTRVLRQRLL